MNFSQEIALKTFFEETGGDRRTDNEMATQDLRFFISHRTNRY